MYTVLAYDQTIGSLLIKFSDHTGPMNIDVPILEDGNFMSGDELDAYIRSFIPTSHLNRLEAIKNGVPNEDEIKRLAPPEQLPTEDPETIAARLANQQMLQEMVFEKKIGDLLVKFGVLETNPVVVPVQEL